MKSYKAFLIVSLALLGLGLKIAKASDKMTCQNVFTSTEIEKALIGFFFREREGLASIKLGDKWGFSNIESEIVIKPEYEEVGFFSENFAEVKEGDEWGFINREGKKVIRPQYEEVGFFSEGFAAVKEDDKWGFINKEGKKIIRCQFDAVGFFRNGEVRALLDGEWLFIDKTGNRVQRKSNGSENKTRKIVNRIFKILGFNQ
ncbi:MAG: WG repeat-containing protein [Bdellovibrionaceae bacterium]|nr:WG repeat-containing protein [Pseudobdellovibrionaceae bacterium]